MNEVRVGNTVIGVRPEVEPRDSLNPFPGIVITQVGRTKASQIAGHNSRAWLAINAAIPDPDRIYSAAIEDYRRRNTTASIGQAHSHAMEILKALQVTSS